MRLGSSKLTARGQISVPAEVRRKLGLAPGSVLEWEEQGDHVLVRRAGQEVNAALFPRGTPASRTLSELKADVRAAVRKRHARG